MSKITFTDGKLNELVKRYGPPTFLDREEPLFEGLIGSIISQQLSTKAADTIYKRFLALFNNRFPTPKQIIKIDKEKVRGAGISYMKISYMKDIAKAFDEKLIDEEKIKKMDDEEVMVELIKLRGVGKWTAEMILIFNLKRPDIFSLGDFGLRRAIRILYGITDEKEILKLSENWKPNRSIACWYLWQSLDNSPKI